MKKTIAIASIASLALAASASADFLLVPESNNDRVVLLNASDGSVAVGNFLDVAAAAASVGYTGGSTPIEALRAGDEFWVTDQIADRVWRFDLNGNFVGQYGVDGTGQGLLNNVRGFEVVGNTAFFAQGSDATSVGGQAEGIVTMDITTGAITGSFIGVDDADASYWDVENIGGELYVTNSDTGNDGIYLYETDGTYNGAFVTSDGVSSFDFAQSINVRPNGNILIGGFSLPSGVYEIEPDGTNLGIIAGDGSGPRSAYELGNGRIIWTNGNFIASGDAGSESPILSGASFRFISATDVPAPGAAAVLTLAGLIGLRRRT